MSSAILQMQELLAIHLNKIEELIYSSLIDKNTELIKDITVHILHAGGKRIRPLMTLAIGSIFSNINANHIALATAVELLHTATLLHDDVIDNSITRRGIITANKKWDNKHAILVGDHLFGLSFDIMISTKLHLALVTIAEAACAITEAETWQLDIIDNKDFSLENYIKLIIGKTAALFRAACACGGIASDVDNSTLSIINEYGHNFGIAFQLLDDLLDYIGNSTAIGKDTMQDIVEGKPTLPFILMYNASNQDEKIILSNMLQKILSQENKEYISTLMIKYQIKQQALEKIKYYFDRAMAALSPISNSQTVQLLFELHNELMSSC